MPSRRESSKKPSNRPAVDDNDDTVSDGDDGDVNLDENTASTPQDQDNDQVLDSSGNYYGRALIFKHLESTAVPEESCIPQVPSPQKSTDPNEHFKFFDCEKAPIAQGNRPPLLSVDELIAQEKERKRTQALASESGASSQMGVTAAGPAVGSSNKDDRDMQREDSRAV